MKRSIIAMFLMTVSVGAYAADFSDLQKLKASNIKTTVEVPTVKGHSYSVWEEACVAFELVSGSPLVTDAKYLESKERVTSCNMETYYETVCQTVYNQQCGYEWVEVCQNVCGYSPHQVCNQVPHQVCRDVPHQVCQTVCTPQNSTTDAAPQCQQVCHTEYTQECHTAYTQQCHMENSYECHNECRDEQQYLCHQVPSQQCHQEPREHEVCNSHYGKSVKKDVRVQIMADRIMFPWEKDSFKSCLKGTELTFNTVSAPYYYGINKVGDTNVTYELSPSYRVPTPPDQAGITNTSISANLPGSSIDLKFREEWASVYAGEKVGLHLELWNSKNGSNWGAEQGAGDKKISEKDFSFEVGDTYSVSMPSAGLKKSKYYYVKWNFFRDGSISTRVPVESRKTGTVYWY